MTPRRINNMRSWIELGVGVVSILSLLGSAVMTFAVAPAILEEKVSTLQKSDQERAVELEQLKQLLASSDKEQRDDMRFVRESIARIDQRLMDLKERLDREGRSRINGDR